MPPIPSIHPRFFVEMTNKKRDGRWGRCDVFLVGGNEKEVGTSQVVTRDPMVVLVGGKAAQGGGKALREGCWIPVGPL
jgi:hypothetical protein